MTSPSTSAAREPLAAGALCSVAVVAAALLAAGGARAEETVLTIDDAHERWSIWEALRERAGDEPATDPAEVAASTFERPRDGARPPVWFAIDLDVADARRSLYLSRSPPYDLGVAFVRAGDSWTAVPVGDDELIPLPLESGRSRLLIRLDSLSRAPDQLEITTLAGHVAAREAQFLGQGAYAGAALLAMLSNLVLGVRGRGRANAAYAALVAANVAFFSLRSGVVSWLAPGALSAGGSVRAEVLALIASAFMAVLFTRELFDTRQTLRRLDAFLLAYLVPLGLLFGAVSTGHAGYGAARWIGLSMPIVAASTGIAALRERHRAAVPYLVGWSFYLLGALALASPFTPDIAGVQPGQVFQLGSALELASLSIALATRLRSLEAERARDEARRTRDAHLTTLGKLAAGVAHEVNNPNNLITFNVPLLERYVSALADPETAELSPKEAADDARAALVELRGATDRITSIVSQLKGHARAPSERTRATLDAIATRAIASVHHRARPGLELEHRPAAERPEPAPPVEMVVEQIERAVTNLLENALDATRSSASARVVVRTGAERDAVWIEVADDGPGVAPELAPRIFEPFVTAREGGTGLGLALAWDTAHEHGGTLELRRGERETIFRLTLPLGAR